MQRKLVVLLLVASMVLGVFNLAVAEVGKGYKPDLPDLNDLDVPKSPEFAEDVLEAVTPGEKHPEPDGAPPEFVTDLLKAIGAPGYQAVLMAREQLQVNGEALESDLPPFIMNGRFLIPIRAVATSLDAQVDWDGDEQKITITRDEDGIEIVIELWVGETTIFVNGEAQEMDVPAQIFVDRAFVPVRFVATALGDNVRWDAEARTAFIESKRFAGEGE